MEKTTFNDLKQQVAGVILQTADNQVASGSVSVLGKLLQAWQYTKLVKSGLLIHFSVRKVNAITFQFRCNHVEPCGCLWKRSE